MKRTSKIIVAVGAAVSLGLASASVGASPFGYGPDWHMGGGGLGIGMLLFWGLIIFAVIMLVRGFAGPTNLFAGGSGVHDKTALDLLGERYAKGEIGKAEFEQKRNDLSGAGAVSGAQGRRGLHNASRAEAS